MPYLAGLVALCLALGSPGTTVAGADEPSLKTVLGRAAAYATDYHQRFTVLVAEEHYVQRVGPERTPSDPPRQGVDRERTLKSDYILVSDFAGTNTWLGVREVLEMDGEEVNTDRERLRALLDDTSRPVASRLRALADLQANYNLGDLYRTINVPTLPLVFLLPDRQPRFRFKHTGTATFHDTPVWIVSYEEKDRPTIIKTPQGTTSRRAAVSGSIRRLERFFEPSFVPVSFPGVRCFHHHPRRIHAYNSRFEMLLPDDMNELYLTGRTRIEAHATYTNYRRWEAEVRIK